MATTWDDILRQESQKDYFVSLMEYVRSERSAHEVFPPGAEVFAALDATPLHEVRVVILGQDPYHGAGQAHGLAFSVQRGVRIPPSLRNILRELHDDTGIAPPDHGDLSSWARQGVLLLNTTLTVRSGAAGSHSGRGWETFTDEVIRSVNDLPHRVVFVLWGNHARAKRNLISNTLHSVVESAHPSPLSARNGFFGSRPFTRTNALLAEHGLDSIDWDFGRTP